jgi:WhiB family redox-sensing transcriptional regulator
MRLSGEARARVRWQDQALCARTDSEAYFEHPTSAAKRRCLSECPVRQECLEFALDTGAVGMWGGTSPKERRKIKAERRRRARAVA